jgi:hypothetical protein
MAPYLTEIVTTHAPLAGIFWTLFNNQMKKLLYFFIAWLAHSLLNSVIKDYLF